MYPAPVPFDEKTWGTIVRTDCVCYVRETAERLEYCCCEWSKTGDLSCQGCLWFMRS